MVGQCRPHEVQLLVHALNEACLVTSADVEQLGAWSNDPALDTQLGGTVCVPLAVDDEHASRADDEMVDVRACLGILRSCSTRSVGLAIGANASPRSFSPSAPTSSTLAVVLHGRRRERWLSRNSAGALFRLCSGGRAEEPNPMSAFGSSVAAFQRE